jgi:hypothetical protein
MTQELCRIILQVLVVLTVPPAAFAVAGDRDFVLTGRRPLPIAACGQSSPDV